jgi:hypothetical protein
MSNQLFIKYQVCIENIKNLNKSINEININNELINNIEINEYEGLINNILYLYKNILDNTTSSIKSIKKQNKKFIKNKNKLIEKIDNLLVDINNVSTIIDNKLFIIPNKTITDIDNYYNHNQYKLFDNSFINDENNLELIDYNIFINEKIHQYDTLILPKRQYIDLGFENLYELPVYKYLSSNIPLNIVVYIEELKSVIIKIGNEKKYKYINSSIGRISNNNENDNKRSIICNNNLVKYNKKCINGKDCSYYHDPIIGFADIAHTDRQFSHNPLIYNCPNFKDGKYIKENVKKVNWEEGLNLYQTSFSCILMAMVHSLI